jgi:hypothetical protein
LVEIGQKLWKLVHPDRQADGWTDRQTDRFLYTPPNYACGGYNKNCLWWPYLLTDKDEMSNLYREPSIDASYQVSVHLAKQFQRRRSKCEELTDDRRWTPSDGKSSHCLWQGELKTCINIFFFTIIYF